MARLKSVLPPAEDDRAAEASVRSELTRIDARRHPRAIRRGHARSLSGQDQSARPRISSEPRHRLPMDVRPEFSTFAAAYDEGRPQVLWTALVADLDTPVSAMLKLADGPAEQLPAGIGGGRRDPRPLFLHRPRPRPDLALPGRSRRTRSGPRRRQALVRLLPGRREGRRAGLAARRRRRVRGSSCRRACRRCRRACSATWATTWCG